MIKLDENQKQLQREFDNLKLILNYQPGFFAKIFASKQVFEHSGLYIYSKPGTGKTMLMKKFYNQVSVSKSYFHFNDFMYKIHLNNHKIRKNKKKEEYSNKDLFESLKRVTKDSKLVCFDEFQVSDIADAMLLERIFTYFIENGVFLVLTSNSEPQNLYPNGIQREIFMKFVKNHLIEKFKVIHFNSEIDYRLIHKKNIEQRYFTKDEVKKFDLVMLEALNGENPLPMDLEIWGRKIKIKKTVDNIAIFDYEELCQKNRSAADFKAICGEFGLIFLKNLPKFSSESKNEIKRFMLFIDEVYENRVALIILAKVAIEDLYSNKNDSKTNARVTSRLNEIKSDFYFNNSKYIKNDA